MKLFSKTLYHGTPHDFDKFDTEHIGSGEGHQVHGWGLYFAENKDVVTERYSNRLAQKNSWYELTLDGKKYKIENNLDEYEQLVELGIPKVLSASIDVYSSTQWKKMFDNDYTYYEEKAKTNPDGALYIRVLGEITFSEAFEQYKKAKEYLDNHEFDYQKVTPKATIFTVEVPDDLVFLDEDENINDDILRRVGYSNRYDKTKEVKDIILKVFKEYLSIYEDYIESKNLPLATEDPSRVDNLLERFANWIADDLMYVTEDKYEQTIDKAFDNVYYSFGRVLDCIDWHGATPMILQALKNVDIAYFDYVNGKKFYNMFVDSRGSPKEASMFLESKGINGITYWGKLDGRCYVIFNPNNINIVEKES